MLTYTWKDRERERARERLNQGIVFLIVQTSRPPDLYVYVDIYSTSSTAVVIRLILTTMPCVSTDGVKRAGSPAMRVSPFWVLGVLGKEASYRPNSM